MNQSLTLQSGNTGNVFYVPVQSDFATNIMDGNVTTLGPFTVERSTLESLLRLDFSLALSVTNPLLAIGSFIKLEIIRNGDTSNPIFTETYYLTELAEINHIYATVIDTAPTQGLSVLGKPITYSLNLLADILDVNVVGTYTLNALNFTEILYPQELDFTSTST